MAHIIDGDNVGVSEPRGRPRFAQETLHKLVFPDQVGGEHLHGYVTVQKRVVPAIDHPHPSPADLGSDFEFAQFRIFQIVVIHLGLSKFFCAIACGMGIVQPVRNAVIKGSDAD
jgi:hypothetical protein